MTEQELVRAAAGGDTEAFEALVLEHQNKVYSLALRMVGNEEDARDMAQEAFIRAFNSLGSFRGESVVGCPNRWRIISLMK